jgi:hypothetical protein
MTRLIDIHYPNNYIGVHDDAVVLYSSKGNVLGEGVTIDDALKAATSKIIYKYFCSLLVIIAVLAVYCASN